MLTKDAIANGFGQSGGAAVELLDSGLNASFVCHDACDSQSSLHFSTQTILRASGAKSFAMKSIGEQAREFRQSKGWSYAQMAREVQKHFKTGTVSRQKITQLEEKGDRRPHYIGALAKTMGTTIEALESGRGLLQGDTATAALDEVPPAPAPHEAPSADLGPPDLVITEYDTGGGMDTQGQLLLDDQPGIIRSWRVTQEWLRLNVPSHSGLRNLCIVTGFGPSMRPMFNPGDPLLVDTGVKVVNHEGVYFFRVGEEGFIKLIQRVPEFDGPGFSLRIISKNPDYPPYEISPRNPHFEVLGKVLTVWRSEQY